MRRVAPYIRECIQGEDDATVATMAVRELRALLAVVRAAKDVCWRLDEDEEVRRLNFLSAAQEPAFTIFSARLRLFRRLARLDKVSGGRGAK